MMMFMIILVIDKNALTWNIYSNLEPSNLLAKANMKSYRQFHYINFFWCPTKIRKTETTKQIIKL